MIELQTIWLELGMPLEERELALSQIEMCLENTYDRSLLEANNLREIAKEKINKLHIININICKFLGYEDTFSTDEKLFSFQHLEFLEDRYRKLYLIFLAASKRRDKIVNEVNRIIKAVEPLELSLSNNLQSLLNKKGKTL